MNDTYPLVFVEWLDSCGPNRWHYAEDTDDQPVSVQSVGWLVRDEQDAITVVPHYGREPEQHCGDMTIPRCAVRQIQYLTTNGHHYADRVPQENADGQCGPWSYEAQGQAIQAAETYRPPKTCPGCGAAVKMSEITCATYTCGARMTWSESKNYGVWRGSCPASDHVRESHALAK